MSAEGKKKRGVSGASNAKNIPFRYGSVGAWRPPYSTNSVPAKKFSRNTMMGLIGGALAAKLGHRLPPFSASLEMHFDDLAKRCPVAAAELETILG